MIICQDYIGYTHETCEGAVNMNAPILPNVVIRRYVDPELICYMLKMCDSPKFVKENFTEW